MNNNYETLKEMRYLMRSFKDDFYREVFESCRTAFKRCGKKYNDHISVNYCDFLRFKCISVEISIEPYLNLTMEKNIPNSRIHQKLKSIMKSNAQLLDAYFESYDLKKA